MKKTLAAGFVLAVLFGVLAVLFGSPASAATPCVAGTAVVSGNTAKITNDPDSGDKGNWAVDNFTRTTDILDNCDGTFTVNIHDSGTFTTLPGGPSPRQGLPLPLAPLTGSFNGATVETVHSTSQPTSVAIPTIDGSPSTSQWFSRFFAGDEVTGTEGAYSWTYKTACERWVDADSSNSGADVADGDITGKVCAVKTPPPTTTVTTPPTTVVNNVPGATKTVTTVQQVKAPVGAPETGGGSTAHLQDAWLLFVILGIAVAILGGSVLYARSYYKRSEE